MKKRAAITGIILLTVVFGLVIAGVFPVNAAPPRQLTPFPTPTPGPDGRIIYIVQTGDTLWRIAAITGLSLDEIRLLNNLSADEPILPGQQLLLGQGGPVAVSPTSGPSPTPTSRLPTPTPSPGAGTICVLLFDDVNGDAFHQETEPSIGGGAISITNRAGTVSETADTRTVAAPGESECFEELPEGNYNVTVAVPEGYNATSLLNYPLVLRAGDETFLAFGAQLSTQAQIDSPPPAEGGRSPMLGLIGGALLVVGVGLGLFAGRLTRQRPA
jgi:hypothetical protein